MNGKGNIEQLPTPLSANGKWDKTPFDDRLSKILDAKPINEVSNVLK